jgi:molecular chaperone GrpE
MSTTDGAVWPDEPVPAGVQPGPRANEDDNPVALNEELADTKDRLRRVTAELDNTRKRNARQAADLRAAARAEAAASWLPLIDNLDRALEYSAVAGRGDTEYSAVAGRGDTAGRSDPIVEGVRAVRDQAVSLLEKLGFARHAEVRVPFDPYLHEAVGVTHDVDAEPGTVVAVVRPGYGEGDRQLRPAGVVVAGQRG